MFFRRHDRGYGKTDSTNFKIRTKREFLYIIFFIRLAFAIQRPHMAHNNNISI